MKHIKYVLLALFLLGGVWGGSNRIQQVQAQTILTEAFAPPSSPNGYIIYHVESYERPAPSDHLPTDPYHLPFASVYSGEQTMTVERYGNSLRQTTYDAVTGALLSDYLCTETECQLYTFASGESLVMPNIAQRGANTGQGQPSFVPVQENPSYDKRPSSTPNGVPTWVISRQRPADPSVDARSFGLYTADLTIESVTDTWTITREGHQLVSRESIAHTPQGDVLLARWAEGPRQTAATPPAGWLDPLDGVPAPQVSSTPSVDDVAQQPAATVIEQLASPVYLPQGLSLSQAWAVADKSLSPLTSRFDIHLAAEQGLATQVVYPLAQEGQVLVLIQGEAATLVPLMQQTLPDWEQSEARSIQFAGQKISAWHASGGVLDNAEPIRHILMFEAEEQFFYLYGQGISIDDLIVFAESLEVYP